MSQEQPITYVELRSRTRKVAECMSRRIAHRPRYSSMRYRPQPPLRSHKEFLRNRWTYRRLTVPYQKRTLGQGLLLLPFGYRLIRDVIIG